MERLPICMADAMSIQSLASLMREQVHSLTLQLLERIRCLHRVGYTHGDLKPQNICLSKDEKTDELTLYLIDFGMAQSFLDKRGQHRRQRSLNLFKGNLLFASTHQCQMGMRSRRDDFESIFYFH